jgi:hypothetical protein
MPGNVTVRIDVGEGTLENRTYVRASCLGLVRQEWLQDIHLIFENVACINETPRLLQRNVGWVKS